jgi:hypothetical protein
MSCNPLGFSLQSTLDEATDPWGVQVERVEVKDVRVPEQLQRAMAAEAEAAREARAKVIAAEGEHKASRALRHAAEIIADCPAALQVIISDVNPFFFLRGLSCPRCVQASLSPNCQKLARPGFQYNLLLVSCGDICFKNKIDQVSFSMEIEVPWPLTDSRANCPLQAFLLGHLVGCYSPLQIVMVVWHAFFEFEACQTAIIVCSGLPHPTQQVKIFKQCAK